MLFKSGPISWPPDAEHLAVSWGNALFRSGLSEHPRPTSGLRVSTGDAFLHSSGKDIITLARYYGQHWRFSVFHVNYILNLLLGTKSG
jgi:hypothetical protein